MYIEMSLCSTASAMVSDIDCCSWGAGSVDADNPTQALWVLSAAWAIYKEQHGTWVMVLYLCQTLWAAGRTGQKVVDHVSD